MRSRPVAMAVRIAAVGCWIAAVAVQHGVGVALGAAGLGLILVPVAWRPRAPAAEGSVHSQSADLVSGNGRQLPGQLSLTPTDLVWTPSRYSKRRGAIEVRVSISEGPVTLRPGTALTDLVVDVSPLRGEHVRLLTHRSRELLSVLGHSAQ